MPRQNQGPHLSEKPNVNGYFEILWTDPGTGRSKHHSTGERTKKAAQIYLAQWVLDEQADQKRGAIVIVKSILADYKIEHVDEALLSKGTAEIGIRHLDIHFGNTIVPEITIDQCRDYADKRRAGKIGWVDEDGKRRGYRKADDGTIRRELGGILVPAISHAVKSKRLKEADVPHIEMPPEPEARDRWLTDAERERLLSAAMTVYVTSKGGPRGGTPSWQRAKHLPRIYRFIALALDTAARKEAIETLTWFQVDLERRKIALNPKGRRQTKKRRPPIAMSDWLHTVLVQTKAEQEERAQEMAEKTGKPLANCRTEYVLDHPGSIRSAFESAIERAGLAPDGMAEEDKVTPHTLRHTWATRAAQEGVNLRDIAHMLGDTMATVEKRYIHHCPDHLRGAANFRKRKLANAEDG